jgi:hypothetical protein
MDDIVFIYNGNLVCNIIRRMTTIVSLYGEVGVNSQHVCATYTPFYDYCSGIKC